jgi:succinate dehydrogenase hydrophobic anchor subunit
MRPRALIRVTCLILLLLLIVYIIVYSAMGNVSCTDADPNVRQSHQIFIAFFCIIEFAIVGIIGVKLSKHARDGLGMYID